MEVYVLKKFISAIIVSGSLFLKKKKEREREREEVSTNCQFNI